MLTIQPDVLDLIAKRLEAANREWEEGRATSPDSRDFVLIAHRTLLEKVPGYHGSLFAGDTGYQEEKLADALYSEMTDGHLDEWPELARWLVDELVG